MICEVEKKLIEQNKQLIETGEEMLALTGELLKRINRAKTLAKMYKQFKEKSRAKSDSIMGGYYHGKQCCYEDEFVDLTKIFESHAEKYDKTFPD